MGEKKKNGGEKNDVPISFLSFGMFVALNMGAYHHGNFDRDSGRLTGNQPSIIVTRETKTLIAREKGACPLFVTSCTSP